MSASERSRQLEAYYLRRYGSGYVRTCVECDLPTVSSQSRYCLEHRQAAEDRRVQRRYRRGLTPEELERARERERARVRVRPPDRLRGYGPEHRALRKQVKAVVDAGMGYCARCGGWIVPGSAWDLGHVDGDRSAWSGPEHRACNRATAAHAKARKGSRRW